MCGGRPRAAFLTGALEGTGIELIETSERWWSAPWRPHLMAAEREQRPVLSTAEGSLMHVTRSHSLDANRRQIDKLEPELNQSKRQRIDGGFVTIAACYLSPEGLVLGADSTSTYSLGLGIPGFTQNKHYNYGQKIFEIGDGSTLAMVTWGLGGLSVGSYRTLIAQLADDLLEKPANSVLEVAERWADRFWTAYTSALQDEISRLADISSKGPMNPSLPNGDAATRTMAEEFYLLQHKQNLVVGFCIGGYLKPDRQPAAFELIFDPLLGKPTPEAVPLAQSFWGVPALITRLIKGCADEVMTAILSSGKWTGTQAELEALIAPHQLAHPKTVPIREAIDFTHACLLTTIKAMKFSNLPQVCGGPIELAVVTTDRAFRWVRHKTWEAAIKEGGNGL